MKTRILAALVALVAGALVWVACDRTTSRPGANTTPTAPAASPESGMAIPGGTTSGSPIRGSAAHRAALEQEERRDFARRVRDWKAAGKSDAFIAYMREKGLERRLSDIRNQPQEWFTLDALKARIREREERDAALFLSSGYPREEVRRLVGEELEALRR